MNRTSLMPSIADPPRWWLPHETRSNGCFETMRAYQGKIFRLNAHLDRLYASAKFLGTRAPVDREHLGRRLRSALERSGIREAVVRVALMPGDGEARPHTTHTLSASEAGVGVGAHPSIVVQRVVLPSTSAYRRGIRVAIVPARKFAVGSITPQAKYSARLGSVMAVMEAQLRGMDEALFMDALGYVTESTASNFGIIRQGTILTAPCSTGLLAGITRDVLFELAEGLQVPIREVPFTRHDVYNAEEAFLSSTIKEVLAVTSVDGRRIGTGKPGPITKRLRQAFKDLVTTELKPL